MGRALQSCAISILRHDSLCRHTSSRRISWIREPLLWAADIAPASGYHALASRIRSRSDVGTSAAARYPLRFKRQHRKLFLQKFAGDRWLMPVLKLALDYWRDFTGRVHAGCTAWHIPSSVLH